MLNVVIIAVGSWREIYFMCYYLAIFINIWIWELLGNFPSAVSGFYLEVSTKFRAQLLEKEPIFKTLLLNKHSKHSESTWDACIGMHVIKVDYWQLALRIFAIMFKPRILMVS